MREILMLAETQDEIYFNRMKSSIGDKSRMVEHIPHGRVLDVGSGGGEFAAMLMKDGYTVVALDGSREAVTHSNALGVTTVEGFTHQAAALLPPEYFNTITCSSILHEVYSYGDGSLGSNHTLTSVVHSLNQFKQVLAEGGRVVIRDGVMPADWNQMTEVLVKDVEGMRLAEKYLNMIPFRSSNHNTMRKVNLEVKEGTTDVLVGNMESVMEFLYTYTWGEENYGRETQELYGIFTLTDYVAFFEANGFHVTHAEEYLQEGYPLNLEQKVELSRNGRSIPFPSSNCLIVAEKR